MESPGNKTSSLEQYQFLSGGGEMGALMRAKDWSKTPVGPVSNWPQSLRTTLGIILKSRFPMFLWWGPKLICFYNDAYRPSLGQNGKHPSILGMPAEKAWSEIWDIIKPLIDQVLAGGEATWSEDQLIPIFRNGGLEDVYWTFSYSPVNDESGKIAGVLVTCNETTEKVNTLRRLEESNRRYYNNIIQAPVAMCIFTGKNHVVEIANDLMLELWGKTGEQVMNKPIFEGLPEAKGQGLEPLIDQVYNTGKKFTANERPVNLPRHGKIETTYINFVWEALKDEDGTISGIVAIATEVTQQVLARKKIEESEQDLRNMVLQAPIGICILDAASLVSEIVNDSFIEVAGKPYEAIAGKYYWDTFAEARPYYESALNKVVEEGIPFHANEVELMLVRHGKEEIIYVTFVYAPLKNAEGKIKKVAIWVLENTVQVMARKKTEEADKRFRNTVKQAPMGITILRGPQFIVEMANDAYLRLVDKKEAEFVGRPLFDSLPEVEATVHPLLDEVLKTGVPFHGIEYPIPVDRYGKHELSYFDFLYYPLKEDDGTISGVIVTVTDVSESVKAKHYVTESEKQFRNMVMQSPIPMTIFRGKDFIIEMANAVMFTKIWRRKESEILGKKLLDAFPELRDQKYPELLEEVYRTGTTYREIESLAYIQGDDELKKFYFDYEYSPLFEPDGRVSGIMITIHDVTEKVDARIKVEEGEERLRLATEATGLSTWDLDLQTREIIHSPRLAEIFGHPASKKLTHVNLRSQIHPEEKELVEKAFELAMESGIIWYEARVVQPGGGTYWIRTQGKVFYDKTGKPVKLIGTLRDITDEKYYEQELQESEQKFRLLADSMPQHIWTADLQGNLNYFNQSVFDYAGITPGQIFKDGWLQIVHPDDREGNISAWMNSVTSGKDFIFEHRFRRYDGEYRWQLSRAIPKRDKAGNIQMWVGTSTDIQEIKEHDQQKDYFISMASHELKTPITSIKGYAQILQGMYMNSEDAFLKNSLRVFDKQIEKLTRLISDLLDVSKVKSGNLILSKENFSLQELLKETIDEIKHINPDYDFVLSPDTKTILYADRERISQVLRNLLTNAVKYSPLSRIVNVKCTGTKGEVTVSIEDSGIGISRKDQEKIFERFYRVEGKNEKTFPGFGIGLFISAEIIHRHHGKIAVESEPGKGSRFYFSLPLDREQAS